MKRSVAIIVIVAVAIVAGVSCWFFGLNVVPSVVVVLVVAGLGATVGLITVPTGAGGWPPAPPEPKDGARREVSELSWALRPSGALNDRVLERVRNIAAVSLSRRHLDLENPAHRQRIEGLVGASLSPFLISAGGGGGDLKGLLILLRTLERLDLPDTLKPPAHG